ncbi:GNAT family N-acetyltransferase [Fluviibacterium sp. DFM31]|uniref:GNAT family N-acetyltransferase n=1 Tax=Meridianimarinicoccus marinus TaxID=3231483 RepID=A0ABV3L6M3_9RHOB
MQIDPKDIHRHETGTKGRYSYRGGPDLPEAELTWSKLGAHQIILDHTGVPDVYRGQGIGAALVAHAVAEARAAGLKITPLCPFAAAQFRKHPDWADVLA